MTGFIVGAVVLWLVVIAVLAQAFWPRKKKQATLLNGRQDQNTKILSDRLSELKLEQDKGLLTEQQFKALKEDLEKELIYDIRQEDVAETSKSGSVKHKNLSFAAIVAALIILPVILYSYQGHFASLSASSVILATSENSPLIASQTNQLTIEESVKQLAERLKTNPNNPQAWFLLASYYMSMQRFPEAVTALEKVHQQVGDDPTVLVALADALSMSNNSRLEGRPFDLVKRALQLEPDNINALWLAGLGYLEQADYDSAIKHWQKLQPLLTDNPQSLLEINELIRDATNQKNNIAGLAKTPQAKNSKEFTQPSPANEASKGKKVTLTINVSLAKALKDKTNPEDTVFVLARAMQGPPMPLAVQRLKVSDLPATIKLDDNMAMLPDMSLSKFVEVSIEARVSKSGLASKQSVDFRGGLENISTDNQKSTPLTIEINEIVP